MLSQFNDEVDPENIEFTVTEFTKRAVYLNKLLEHFWKRWSNEYLTELREYQNCKSKLPAKQVAIGDVVLVQEDNLPRNKWRMAVITKLYEGRDGHVRVRTSMKKRKGVSYLNRPVNKLYPLEITNNEYLNSREGTQDGCIEQVACSQSNRPRRAAAEMGILRRVWNNQI